MKVSRMASATSVMVAAIMSSLPTKADVYISYDSIQPTYERELAQAQIDAFRDNASANRQLADTQTFLITQMATLANEQQKRAENRMEMAHAQQYVALQQAEINAKERKQIELRTVEIREMEHKMLEDYHARELEMKERHAAEMRALYEAKNAQEKEFLTQQANIQNETMKMQKAVYESQDALLAHKIASSAPQNIIVASNDASNLKQKINAANIDSLGQIQPAEEMDQLVFLNEFILSILPTGWEFTPAPNSSSDMTNIVVGTDWTSIINQIAIANPHMEFLIDTNKKLVSVSYVTGQRTKANYNPHTSWHITTSKSLRQNLEHFANRAKWTLIWDAYDMDSVVDYPIVAPATIQTDFSGKDGIVNKLMISTQTQEWPLEAKWSLQNRVVRIIRSGASVK